jgi:phosphate/phosphite/phosphonate ABC transporter binding protein
VSIAGGGDVPTASEFVLGLNPVIQREGADAAVALRPLIRYLTRALNIPVRIVVEHDYEALIAALKADEIDAALMGEYAFHLAQREAGAEALAVSVEVGSNEAATYQSIIIAGAETPIHTLRDLRGVTIGFVEGGSTAGYLIPRRMLRESGIDPDTETQSRFYPSHPEVAEAVIAGEVDAGALHGNQLTRVLATTQGAAAKVRTVAMSAPVPKGPLAVRRGLDREVRQRLLQALLTIHDAAPEAASFLQSPGTRWRPTSNRNVTLKTVAALSGVSYGTVSRVINGRAHVAPETYTRVMSIVQDLGFRPNAAAVSLIANRSDLVGFVVPDADDPLIARYLAGIHRALAEAEMHVVVCPVQGDRAEESRYLSLLDDGRFGGLILTPWSMETPQVSTLASAGHALVLLGSGAGGAPVPAIAPDVDACAVAACDYLRELGHQAIGALLTAADRGSVARALGADRADTAIRTVEADAIESARTVASDLLAHDAACTALICGTERIALGVMQAAAERGRRIPDDLSLLTLTETWLAAAVTPPLTSVAIPAEIVGERAGQALLDQMSGGERPPSDLSPLVPVVTRRGSTAPRQ